MSDSWSAEGLLRPLWGRVGGRDALSRLTGIPGPNLSGYNTGRLPLGVDAARRIALALDVDLSDLGYEGQPEHPSPLMREVAGIREALDGIVTSRAYWAQHIESLLEHQAEQAKAQEGHLSIQTALLGELTAVAGRLEKMQEGVGQAVLDLRSALDEFLRELRRQRPA